MNTNNTNNTNNTAMPVGTILDSTWGYDCTGVDYYEVIRSTAKTVWLRELKQKTVEQTGWGSWNVKPIPGEYASDEVLRRRIDRYGTVKIADRQHASIWDGKANYTSID